MSKIDTIQWNDEYSVGIKSIDNQHKKLFVLVNKLYDLEDNENAKEQMREILYGFFDYTKVHFKNEEEYMASIGYPDLKEHQKVHQHLIEVLSQLIKTPASLPIIKTKMKVVAKRVLVDHIINFDHKYGEYQKSVDEKEISIDNL